MLLNGNEMQLAPTIPDDFSNRLNQQKAGLAVFLWKSDMTYNPEIHHRKSCRLRGYDYAANGAYFVTLCTHGRECLFGEIGDGGMVLNDAGLMVAGWWANVVVHFPNVVLDEYIIMPNHFHGIVLLNPVGAGSPRPMLTNTNQGGETPPLRMPTLGQVVGYFKYQATKQINIMRDNPGVPVWQRNYHERIIRSEAELHAIREYIQNNPANWAEDKEYPHSTP